MTEEVSKVQLLGAHLMVFVLGPFFFRASLGERWSEPDYKMLAISFVGCLCWLIVGLTLLQILGVEISIMDQFGVREWSGEVP